jgi:ABC-type xylose transport system permease subunit
MSNKDDGESLVNIRTILLVIAVVLIWIGFQSFTGVSMKMK